MKTTYRIEIVEEQGGWWASQIWDSDGKVIYQSNSRNEQAARSQAGEVYFRLAGPLSLTTKPQVTIKHLGSKSASEPKS
jgi:hypothetical protein